MRKKAGKERGNCQQSSNLKSPFCHSCFFYVALSLLSVEKKHLKAGCLQEWKLEQHEVQLGCSGIIMSVYWIVFATLPDATTFLETIIHIYKKEWVHAKPAFSLLVAASVLRGGDVCHATRTLSGSCHPRRGAALKEAENSRGSPPPPPRWFLYMSSGVGWETEIFPPDLRGGGNTEGREDKHLWSSLFFLEEKKKWKWWREFLFSSFALLLPPTKFSDTRPAVRSLTVTQGCFSPINF